MTIILNCPNCMQEFEYDGRYDDGMDEPVECSSCHWVSSKWTFDYVCVGEEDEEQEAMSDDKKGLTIKIPESMLQSVKEAEPYPHIMLGDDDAKTDSQT